MTTKTKLMYDFRQRTEHQDKRYWVKFQGEPVTKVFKNVYDSSYNAFYNYTLTLQPMDNQLYLELTRLDSNETNEHYREKLYYGMMKPYNHYKNAEIHWEKISIYVDIINKRK